MIGNRSMVSKVDPDTYMQAAWVREVFQNQLVNGYYQIENIKLLFTV